MRNHGRWLVVVAALLSAFATFGSAASAQCFQDDGFLVPGTCCLPVNPLLPQFPSMTINSEGACWRNCTPTAVFPQVIALNNPVPIFGDIYIIGLGINGTVNIQPTIMIAKYAR